MYVNVVVIMIIMFSESSAKERLARAEREGGEGEEEERVGEAGVHVVDPLRPFLDYYLQAESGVDALVNIRCVEHSMACEEVWCRIWGTAFKYIQ